MKINNDPNNKEKRKKDEEKEKYHTLCTIQTQLQVWVSIS